MNIPKLQEFLTGCVLSLSLQGSICAQTIECLQNTNLPQDIACHKDDRGVDHTKEILGSMGLAVGLILLWKYNRNSGRKMKDVGEDKEGRKDEKIEGTEGVIDIQEISKNNNEFIPGSDITWKRADQISDNIVAIVVGEDNSMDTIKLNPLIQPSAIIWIQQEDTKNMLSQFAQANAEYIGIHNLMVLSKNQQYQGVIGVLLYYFLYHEPLVAEYEDFFLKIIGFMDEPLDEGRGNLLLGLRTEYDTYRTQFNLSREHLESIKERGLSLMRATGEQ